MSALKIFIVRSSTGEYSDRSEHTVAACLSRESADKLEAECTEFALRFFLHTTNANDEVPEGHALVDVGRYDRVDLAEADPACPYKPFRVDYTGVDFFVEELDVRVHGGKAEIEAFADALMAAREATP